jgi:hypothetical protein
MGLQWRNLPFYPSIALPEYQRGMPTSTQSRFQKKKTKHQDNLSFRPTDLNCKSIQVPTAGDKSCCEVFSYQGTIQNKGNLDLYQLVVNSEEVLSENGYHRQAQMAWRCIQSRTFTATLQNGEHTYIKRVALQILSSSNDGAKLTNKAARE